MCMHINNNNNLYSCSLHKQQNKHHINKYTEVKKEKKTTNTAITQTIIIILV